MLARCGYDGQTNRWTELLALQDFVFPASLERTSPRTFVALVVADARRASDASLYRFASLLLRAGAVFVSTVGPGSARLQQVFEDVILMSETRSDEAHVILTESHGDDLVAALEFVLLEAQPSAGHLDACSSTLVVSVGAVADEAWLRSVLADPDELRARAEHDAASE